MFLNNEESWWRPKRLLLETSRSCLSFCFVALTSSCASWGCGLCYLWLFLLCWSFIFASKIAEPLSSAKLFLYPLWFRLEWVTGSILEDFGCYTSAFLGSGSGFEYFCFYWSDLTKSLFSILQKWECCKPVNCSSSIDQAGEILLIFLEALTIAHAIKYWLVLTNLWSCRLSSTK